ncbi:MAG: ImmA/IrrE family metallo-endopeptidase [Gaiellaceae bacterium]|jgi:Zn-dependent peptidase ImmA (M78 family)
MPLLRCTNEDCDFERFERSKLIFDCPWCGESVEVVSGYNDADGEPRVPGRPSRDEYSHVAHARQRATDILNEHRANTVPVPVRAIVRQVGLKVEEDVDLGASLRARLVNDTIQLKAGSERVKRFSLAHELGHWFLGTRHGDGPQAEAEANAFAGELLVPGPRLLAAITQTPKKGDLARLFNVSFTVIEIAAKTHNKGDLLED